MAGHLRMPDTGELRHTAACCAERAARLQGEDRAPRLVGQLDRIAGQLRYLADRLEAHGQPTFQPSPLWHTGLAFQHVARSLLALPIGGAR